MSTDKVIEAVHASTKFEELNTELKKQYLLSIIEKFNKACYESEQTLGTFGTGYPFYALDKAMKGQLPIIEEQIRYNQELIDELNKYGKEFWLCSQCLSVNYHNFPDLKQICKPCPKINDTLKPRKIINRMPDIDLWTIAKKEDINIVEHNLITSFEKYNLIPSDINPTSSINDIIDIVKQLEMNLIPEKNVPLDAHIIDFDTLLELIEKVPSELEHAYEFGTIAYLPIRPKSYRKVWQYDDEAYNFVFDYLATMSVLENCSSDIVESLRSTRSYISQKYSPEELWNFMNLSTTETTRRRFKNKVLKRNFEEKVIGWRK